MTNPGKLLDDHHKSLIRSFRVAEVRRSIDALFQMRPLSMMDKLDLVSDCERLRLMIEMLNE